MSRAWQFFLVGDKPGRAELLMLARAGGPVFLVRALPDRSAEQTLTRVGDWRDGDRLARIRYRGEVAWDVAITAEQARDIAARWRALGKIAIEPSFEEQVPDDLDQAATRSADIAARREQLRSDHALDAPVLARLRDTLLDGPERFAEKWLQGRLVVPVERAFALTDAESIARRQDGFAACGDDVVWAVIPAPDDVSRAMRLPDGVSCPNEPGWLRALGSLYLGQPGVLLTGPSLQAAMLDTDDYGLVAGAPNFVKTVLGTSIEDAAERFRAYARGGSSIQPDADLSGVLGRYLPERREGSA